MSCSGKAAQHGLCFCFLQKQSLFYINRCVVIKNSQAIVLSLGQSLRRIPLPALGSTNEKCGELGEVSVGTCKDD